jgi:deoxyribodipyrimidine photo-lyase
VDTDVAEVGWCLPGERAAAAALLSFLNTKLSKYADDRNNAALPKATSNLSPYLHFGHISAQRVVLETHRVSGLSFDDLVVPPKAQTVGAQSFIDEVWVRRELSDNYVYYTPNTYDTFAGLADWSRKTLSDHVDDAREFSYSDADLEAGRTHDALWNAAQLEMVRRGKMHGYMRMYWAKKILEWTSSPEDAIRVAIYLNDKYQLDGRDPNGYAGVMWGVGGLHDQGWKERSVFGKVRYMSTNGPNKHFHVDSYIAGVLALGKPADDA